MIKKWNPQKTFGDAGKAVASSDPSRSLPRNTGVNYGKAHGATIGGAIGSAFGPIGMVAGAKAGQNIGGMLGGGVKGYESVMKGNVSGKTSGQPGQPPVDAADVRPKLSAWEGMDQEKIRAIDLFKPTLFTDKAMETGLAAISPWQAMALEKQSAEQAKAMDEAARQQAGALAGARSSMAMRGGLRGGAAERLAASGAQNLAQTMQQQRQVGAIQRGDIGLKGAEMARDIAQGNVAAQTEGQARNIQAALAELAAKRDYDVSSYQEQMKAYAAEKTGQALGKEPKPTLFGDPFGYLKSQF